MSWGIQRKLHGTSAGCPRPLSTHVFTLHLQSYLLQKVCLDPPGTQPSPTEPQVGYHWRPIGDVPGQCPSTFGRNKLIRWMDSMFLHVRSFADSARTPGSRITRTARAERMMRPMLAHTFSAEKC